MVNHACARGISTLMEIVMNKILLGATLALVASPVFAAVEVAPAPQIGLGLPAIGAVLIVGLVVVFLKYRKI